MDDLPTASLATRLQKVPQELFDKVYDYAMEVPNNTDFFIDDSYRLPIALQVDRSKDKRIAYFMENRFSCHDKHLARKFFDMAYLNGEVACWGRFTRVCVGGSLRGFPYDHKYDHIYYLGFRTEEEIRDQYEVERALEQMTRQGIVRALIKSDWSAAPAKCRCC